MASLGKEQGGASNLDLSRECMRTVKAKIQEIWSDYVADFPQQPPEPVVATQVPSAQVDNGIDGRGTTVRASNKIESEEEYNAGKAAWLSQCEKATEESVEQYIASMIVLVTAAYETTSIEQKLRRIPFMSEPGRKLFIYDSFCKDPANWLNNKKNRRNVFAGTKVVMQLSQAGDESSDTLAVTKNIYQSFRSPRADHMSEDIVACLVPGTRGDNPVNETLQMAWKSLKALGAKHVGPKIGTVRINQQDMLAHVFARGPWHSTPDDHLVFTFQAAPQTGQVRKKMRYLKDQERPGDTYYNDWPVPMYQPSQMPKTTTSEHDAIFASDDVVGEGEGDGAGAAMISDLGDKVLPFPREFHAKLWQEMIHVWEIDVAVLFQPGSGQALLAFVLERKHAVGIMKNKAHKDFVYKNLAAAVKSLGLAPDRRPTKPIELTTWETSRAGPGGAAPRPMPQPSPAAPKAPSPAPGASPTLGQPMSGLPAARTPVLPAAPKPADLGGAGLAAFGSAALC